MLFITSAFKKIAEFVLFSSIFIALCAVALCIETNILLHLPLNIFSFYSFVFGATLLQYNLHYLVKPATGAISARHTWSSGKKNIHIALITAGIACMLLSLVHFQLHHFIVIAALAFITFLYSFPVIPFNKKKRLKDYGFAKIITLALMWTLVTVWFPLINFSFEKNIFIFIFFQRLSFMFLLCLLFDVRDIGIDRSENIHTIAVLFGKKISYNLAYIFLIIFTLITVGLFLYSVDEAALAAMLASAALTCIIITVTKKNYSDLFYLSCVDGLMLAQAAFAFLFIVKL